MMKRLLFTSALAGGVMTRWRAPTKANAAAASAEVNSSRFIIEVLLRLPLQLRHGSFRGAPAANGAAADDAEIDLLHKEPEDCRDSF